MIPLTDNSAQHAKNWSSQLGALAAEKAGTPAGVPTRFAAILDYFRRRKQTRQDVQDKFRATQFIMEP